MQRRVQRKYHIIFTLVGHSEKWLPGDVTIPVRSSYRRLSCHSVRTRWRSDIALGGSSGLRSYDGISLNLRNRQLFWNPPSCIFHALSSHRTAWQLWAAAGRQLFKCHNYLPPLNDVGWMNKYVNIYENAIILIYQLEKIRKTDDRCSLHRFRWWDLC